MTKLSQRPISNAVGAPARGGRPVRGRWRARAATGALCAGLLLARAAGADDVPMVGTTNPVPAPSSVEVAPEPTPKITTSNPRAEGPGQRPGGGSGAAPEGTAAPGGTPPGPAVPRAPRRHYTGRRIDLDLKDADIHNILRLLADVGHVEHRHRPTTSRATSRSGCATSPGTRRSTWSSRPSGSAWCATGNLIRVAPLAELEKERELQHRRARSRSSSWRRSRRASSPISYADADELAGARARSSSRPRGTIAVDERTNVLIARTSPANLNLHRGAGSHTSTRRRRRCSSRRASSRRRASTSRDVGIQWGGDAAFADATGNPHRRCRSPSNIGVGGGGNYDDQTPTAGLSPFTRAPSRPELRRQPARHGRHRTPAARSA